MDIVNANIQIIIKIDVIIIIPKLKAAIILIFYYIMNHITIQSRLKNT